MGVYRCYRLAGILRPLYHKPLSIRQRSAAFCRPNLNYRLMFSFSTILCFTSLSPGYSLDLNCLELSTSPIGPWQHLTSTAPPSPHPPPPSSLLFSLNTQPSQAFVHLRNLHVMNHSNFGQNHLTVRTKTIPLKFLLL